MWFIIDDDSVEVNLLNQQVSDPCKEEWGTVLRPRQDRRRYFLIKSSTLTAKPWTPNAADLRKVSSLSAHRAPNVTNHHCTVTLMSTRKEVQPRSTEQTVSFQTGYYYRSHDKTDSSLWRHWLCVCCQATPSLWRHWFYVCCQAARSTCHYDVNDFVIVRRCQPPRGNGVL